MLLKHIEGLDWALPQSIQKRSVATLRREIGTDVSLLMFKNLNKSQWENASQVLEYIDLDLLERFAPELLEWLKDLNWPGAGRVFEICKAMSKDELLRSLNRALLDASEEGDADWMENLLLLAKESNINLSFGDDSGE